MNLDIIEMEPADAAERAAAFSDVKAPNAEEVAMQAGYLALAEGKRLINLTDALRAGGTDNDGWPRLAVMAADKPWCYLHTSTRSSVTRYRFSPAARIDGRTAPRTLASFDLPTPPYLGNVSPWSPRRAMVPPVPPQHRPRWYNAFHALRNFLVLWEVPEWEVAPRPPGDPALLRRLHGDLCIVEAQWDLTPLEQAVLTGRRPI